MLVGGADRDEPLFESRQTNRVADGTRTTRRKSRVKEKRSAFGFALLDDRGRLDPGVVADFQAPNRAHDAIKIYFTLILTSLAITLLAVNQGYRQYNLSIPIWTIREKLVLLIVGFLGGIVSGLVGNGIDIFIFAVMVLLFRISEKVATPTSVIIMAINALTGFAYQVFVIQDFTQPVKSYWLAAIPIVVVGAPIGAIICSKLNRLTINRILIGLILTELITSLLIIPLRVMVICSGMVILLLFSYLNYWMYRTQIYEIPLMQKLNKFDQK